MLPMAFQLEQVSSGIWCAFLHEQHVEEASEILPNYAKEKICIFGVKHVSFDSEKGRLLSLEEIAYRQGLRPVIPDKDIIIIKTTELPRLMKNFNPYDMSLFDVESNVDLDKLIDCVLETIEEEENVLEFNVNSNAYICSHDDCYMYVESRHLAHLRDHLRCLLRSYVCSKLKQLIDMPPIAIVEDYLAFHSSMTILEESTDLDKEILRIPCSAEPYRFGKKKDYPVASTIYFNKETNRWSLENTG